MTTPIQALTVPDGKGGQITITDPKTIEDFNSAIHSFCAPKWQPVTETSPPADAQRVLIYESARGCIAIAQIMRNPFNARSWGIEWPHSFAFPADLEPTHWMPLPEPPTA